MGLKEKEAT